MTPMDLFSKYGVVCDAGKVLFREGNQGNRMYIIQEGKVRISKTIGGKEHTLAVLSPGDFFGEMALVSRIERTATATAATQIKLLTFNRAEFLSMIEKNGRMALNVIDKLCRRLQQANLQIEQLKRGDLRTLLAMNLLYAFQEQNRQELITGYLRTTREISLSMEIPMETVLNVFNQFARMGLIRIDGQDMILVDRKGLAALAENHPGLV